MKLLEALGIYGDPPRVGEPLNGPIWDLASRRADAAERLADEVLLCYRAIRLLSEMLPEFSAGEVRPDLVWSERTVAACVQRAKERGER